MTDAETGDGFVEWGDMPTYWDRVDSCKQQLEQLWSTRRPVTELTSQAFDEAQTAGHRTYVEAQRNLIVAIDNEEAFRTLLNHRGLTVWAPWSLLRPLFECSVLAVWVLEPTDGLERRRRGLHLEVLGFRQHRAYVDSYGAVPSLASLAQEQGRRMDAGSKETYRREAGQLGVSWDYVCRKLNIVQVLEGFAHLCDPDVRGSAVATWRMLSGFEHGLAYAAMQASEVTRPTRRNTDRTVRLVIKDEVLLHTMKVTYLMFVEAANLYSRRCTTTA